MFFASFATRSDVEKSFLRAVIKQEGKKAVQRMVQQQAAQERIRACYMRGIRSLVHRGKLTQEDAEFHRKIDNKLTDFQLQPKNLLWHTPHRLARNHILEHYPREQP